MRTGEPSAFPEPERPLRPSRTQRVKRLLLGRPKNLQDPHLFRHISLIAFLAWVGLGADGLSSSAYGPEEAFKNLGEHRSEEHTSELQSQSNLVCRLLLEKKKKALLRHR